MQPDKNKTDKEKIQNGEKPDEHVEEAYREAEKKIRQDADLLTPPEEQSDLDEGELARKEGHP